MSFKDKYTTTTLKSKDKTDKEKDKIEVSDEAYLYAEMLDELCFRFSRLRRVD